MAYFVRIGPNASNVGKLESRGYQILRRGTAVEVRFAGVCARADKTFVWATHVLFTRYRCKSVARARAKVVELIHERETKGYRRLLPGTSIRKTAGTEYRPC